MTDPAVDWGTLDERSLRVLRRMRDAGLLRDFYLSGGTGLALRLGHRVSLDLDMFSLEPLRELPLEEILDGCGRSFGLPAVRVVLRQPDQLWLEVDQVQVTFLAFPFAHRYPLADADGIALADPRDIAIQKALAIGRRASARDYVDLAWVLRSGATSLEQVVRDAQEAFVLDGEPVFAPKLFLQQLAYTDDLKDREAAVRSLKVAVDFPAVAAELREHVRVAARRLLGSPEA